MKSTQPLINKKMSIAKKTALLGMFLALAFVLAFIEVLIPINLGIPGIKLGLANLVMMVMLYLIGVKESIAVSIIRVILVGFTFGSLSTMMYSFVGAVVCLAVMIPLKESKKFSVVAVSAAGGVAHNIGQILVALMVMKTESVMYYLPILIISGVLSGVAIGLLSGLIIKRLARGWRNKNS